MFKLIESLIDCYGETDYLTKQRAKVLLLTDLIAILVASIVLVFIVAIFRYPTRWFDFMSASIVVLGAVLSLVFLAFGRYKIGAHVLVAFSAIALWGANWAKADLFGIKSETNYLVALAVMPALLLGRIWIIVYGIGSLIVIGYISFRLTATGISAIRTGFTLDTSAAIIFATYAALLISVTYENALNQVKQLLGNQLRSNQSLRELNQRLEQSEVQRRQFYRDTIYSVTDGKLYIGDEEAVEPYIQNSKTSLQITDSQDVYYIRKNIRDYCASLGLEGEKLDKFIIAAGEAITNAIKHAGGGEVFIGNDECRVWVVTVDHGAGIESLILPRAVLLRGYSTKASLGLGYSMMLDAVDEIILKTDETGTCLVLILNLQTKQPEILLRSVPDTW